MKRIDIINMFRTLGKIKLNKVEDRVLRNILLANHPKMYKIAKENDEYVIALREQFDPDAVKEFSEAYQKYADQVVDIDLDKINRESFGDMIAAGDIDMTLNEMMYLEPLFESN